MAAALQDPEEFLEGANGFAVLMREDTGELVKMGEIVYGPSGDELGQSD